MNRHEKLGLLISMMGYTLLITAYVFNIIMIASGLEASMNLVLPIATLISDSLLFLLGNKE